MSEPMLLGGLPKIALHGGATHVFNADGIGVIAGPFPSNVAARWWIVEHIEGTLTPAQRETWTRLMDGHHASHDAGLELGVIDMVRHDKPLEQLWKYLPRRFERRDARALAAGDAA